MAVSVLILGILAAIAGFCISYAGMISDDPDAGDKDQRNGCVVAAVGVFAFCGALLWLMLR